MAKIDVLYIVVPCYNEEAMLPETTRRLKDKLSGLIAAENISDQCCVHFVNDSSKDRTWALIEELHWDCPPFFRRGPPG